MGLPIKISDHLAQSARAEAALNERSITGQIEHWAKLGRVAEQALTYNEVRQAKEAGVLSEHAKQVLIGALTQLVSGKGAVKASEAIRGKGNVLFAADPENPNGVIQVLPTGERVPGRMVNRVFTPN